MKRICVIAVVLLVSRVIDGEESQERKCEKDADCSESSTAVEWLSDRVYSFSSSWLNVTNSSTFGSGQEVFDRLKDLAWGVTVGLSPNKGYQEAMALWPLGILIIFCLLWNILIWIASSRYIDAISWIILFNFGFFTTYKLLGDEFMLMVVGHMAKYAWLVVRLIAEYPKVSGILCIILLVLRVWYSWKRTLSSWVTQQQPSQMERIEQRCRRIEEQCNRMEQCLKRLEEKTRSQC